MAIGKNPLYGGNDNEENSGVWAVQFEGEVAKTGDAYIDMPAKWFNFKTSFTVELWLKFRESRHASICPIAVPLTDPTSFTLCFSDNKHAELQIMWRVILDLVQSSDLKVENSVSPNQWFHVAFTYDSWPGMQRRVRFYLDGVLKESTERPGRPLMPSGGGARVLRNCEGQFAELRIWNEARYPNQIKECMDLHLTGHYPSLIGYWKMDERSGDVLYDSSVNHCDTKLINGQRIRSDLKLKDPIEEFVRSDVELEKAKKQIADANQVAEYREERIKRKVEALIVEKDKTIEENEKKIAALTNQLKVKEEEALAVEKAKSQILLSDFLKKAHSQITTARSEIAEDTNIPYRLEDVAMEVKMIPGIGGVGMTFPQLTQDLQADRLSTIRLNFKGREIEEEGKQEIEVPDLIGYTEHFARRRLGEDGFMVDVSYEGVEDEKDVGRVVRQNPLPWKPENPDQKNMARINSIVTLFIGKLVG